MLSVAMLAAPTPDPGHYGTLEHPIAQAARAWFAPYSDHPAVDAVRQIFYVKNDPWSGFACDAVTSFILRRSEPPDLLSLYPNPESALARVNGDETILDDLVERLRHFYSCSNFSVFWNEQAGEYRKLEDRISGFIDAGWNGEDVIVTMESYFGEGRSAYILVPTPLERPGGGTMEATGGDGNTSIYACFDCTVNHEWVLYLLYHEFGHSFINPLSVRYSALVGQYEELYAPLKEKMKSWGYVNWAIALNEHILRAQNRRVLRKLQGDASAEAQLAREEAQGFLYVRALDNRLAEYETHRVDYPSLADFYPNLIKALDPFLTSARVA